MNMDSQVTRCWVNGREVPLLGRATLREEEMDVTGFADGGKESFLPVRSWDIVVIFSELGSAISATTHPTWEQRALFLFLTPAWGLIPGRGVRQYQGKDYFRSEGSNLPIPAGINPADVVRWEMDALHGPVHDVETMGVYRDWCIDQGWQERADWLKDKIARMELEKTEEKEMRKAYREMMLQ